MQYAKQFTFWRDVVDLYYALRDNEKYARIDGREMKDR